MTEVDIKDLMCYGERINTEYKEALGELPKSLWETYSSFANTIGGTIILGIKEYRSKSLEEGQFEVQGVKNAQKMLKSFWDTINSNKVSRNILLDEQVEVIDYEGKPIMVIQVPMASCSMRPIYINGNLLGGTFKRNFEGDYHCTDEEVKIMLRDANENGNDGMLIENYTMDDIDLHALHSYRNRFEIKNQDHAFNLLNDKDFLRNLGGYTVDRTTNREGLTLAGLMMFGKGLPVRERFDNIRMDYIDKTNLIGDSRWSDRLTYDGTWENNLFNFFIRVIAKLTADLKRPFRLEGMERTEDTPVHKAVREGLTNMIIHADLLITGVLKVEKLGHEFLFSNPGSLKLPMEDIVRGGNSKARNPRIQNMLRMIGYGDNIGSGYPTILKAWKEQNWRTPTLIDRTDLRQVDLTLPMVSMIPDSILEEMVYCFGENMYANLTAQEQIVMACVWDGDCISNIELQQLLGMNSIEVGRILHNMVEKEWLAIERKNRWTIYHLHPSLSDQKEAFLKESEGKDAKSEGKDAKSEGKSAESEGKSAESEGKSAESEGKKDVKLSDNEKKIIQLMKANPHITYPQITLQLSIGETSIYKIVRKLKDLHIIHRENGKKQGYWVVHNDFE